MSQDQTTGDVTRRLIDALLSERDDPRNAVEHPGFREGMTRAVTVVRREMERQNDG